MAAAAGALEKDEAPKEEKRANPLDAITMADEIFFYGLSSLFFRSAACCCLTGCLHLAPFEALRSFIQGDVTIIMTAPSLNGSEFDNTNGGKTTMRMMMVCTERQIICVSWYKNPGRVRMPSPQFPALRNCWLFRCHPL
ncbi:hypothetical protein TcG_10784 [Trypanosoma cruzi]|nr:hypothetical protein TcG_10784 [Trypanosoma cruzi]